MADYDVTIRVEKKMTISASSPVVAIRKAKTMMLMAQPKIKIVSVKCNSAKHHDKTS